MAIKPHRSTGLPVSQLSDTWVKEMAFFIPIIKTNIPT